MRPTPGVECRTRAIVASTLWPGNWPPSPGLAPCAILICIMSELTRYSVVTPKRPEAISLFAAFAGVRLATDPVHGDRERGVRLARDRAEAHRARGEAPDDVLGRLDLIELHRLALLVRGGLDPEQAAQRQQPLGLLVEDLCKRPVALQRVAAHGMLQRGNGFRGPGVVLAAGAVGVLAA